MKTIFVSLINYKNPQDTLECLASLAKIHTTSIDLHILVINNDHGARLKKEDVVFIKNIELLDTRKNLGFAGGQNIGIKRALAEKADYILVINNDVVVDKNFLQHLIKSIESGQSVGAVSPKIYFAKGYEFHKEKYSEKEKGKVIWYAGGIIDWKNVYFKHRGVDEVDHGQYDTEEKTDFVTGCCMLVKREVFEKIGLFDERYFLYYEDSDFNQRIRQAGFTSLYCPKAIIWHKNAGSSGSGSSLHDYYLTRNRLLFGMTYASVRTKLALVREGVRLALTGRMHQKKGARDFLLGRYNKESD